MPVEQITEATMSQYFSAEVMLQYQNTRSFPGVIEEVHGMRGEQVNFPIGGTMEMNEVGFGGGDIPISSLGETNVSVNPKNFLLRTSISGGYETLFNYSKVAQHAKAHSLAMARALDKLVVDAIFNDGVVSTRFHVIPATYGSLAGFSVDKISLAIDLLLDDGVPLKINKNAMIPALARKSLKEDPKFTSWDYNMKRPLMNDSVSGYLDVAFYAVGSKGQNKIPRTGTGTSEDPFVYEIPILAENCGKIVFNRAPFTRIEWRGTEDRWILLSGYTANAKILQDDGVKIVTANIVTQ